MIYIFKINFYAQYLFSYFLFIYILLDVLSWDQILIRYIDATLVNWVTLM